ncbi:hypothetical protein T08_5699 [Trichinella sp. T8]|nr:hypothetical protein T08_5699 [Trichinella sp. T8]
MPSLNSLDLPLWRFHLAMRAFGDCLWPADCSCSSGAELLEAVEPVFYDSFFRIIFETTPSLLRGFDKTRVMRKEQVAITKICLPYWE